MKSSGRWPASLAAGVAALALALGGASRGLADEAARAADGDDVVLRRLFPKSQTVELQLGVGLLLNPTFVDTRLAEASLRYHWSENWGVGLDVAVANTSDRHERACIESFYNDPDHQASVPCAAEDGGAGAEAKNVNLGPAYVPIRELRGLATVSVDYTIAYGKQILLQSATSHFDLRLRLGAGAPRAGVGPAESDGNGLLYGVDGRPKPHPETAPAVFGGVSQELHFARRFFVTPELALYLLLPPGSGVETLVVAQLGFGMRL
jgi:hypothetical protein